MAVNNQLSKRAPTFAEAIKSEGYQNLIKTALRDDKRANRFVTAIISAVSTNEALQKCEPKSVLSAALQGEALELSPSPALGEYYLVPYDKKVKSDDGTWSTVKICQFQIGTAGRIQLAMRSGQFKGLDTIEVREGEYRGRDSETGKPVLVFESDDIKREKLPIVGYYAWYELVNGFRKSVYFSKEKCLEWAEKYSKSFKRDLYDRMVAGETITDWKEKSAIESCWFKHTDEMCKNLVLRQVLKYSPKSIELETLNLFNESNIMRNILDGDDITETDIVEPPKVTAEDVTDDFFGDKKEEDGEKHDNEN